MHFILSYICSYGVRRTSNTSLSAEYDYDDDLTQSDLSPASLISSSWDSSSESTVTSSSSNSLCSSSSSSMLSLDPVTTLASMSTSFEDVDCYQNATSG